jgi:hypothetical protein
MPQGGGNALVVVDAQAAEGPQQRRDAGVVAHLHRNQRLAVFDPLIGEAAHLRVHPRALQRRGRKHDQPRIRLLQAFVHPGDDVVARRDLPGVEPGIDSLLAQIPGQRLHGGFVAGGVAQENPHRGNAPQTLRWDLTVCAPS